MVLSDLRPSSVSWRQPPSGLAERPRPHLPQTAGWRARSGPGPTEYANTLASGTLALDLSPRLGQPALFPGTLCTGTGKQ